MVRPLASPYCFQMATKKRGRPRPDDVRCPNCSSVRWRRVGERVFATASTVGGGELRHETLREDRPWEWTCEQCGYSVRPTDRLDNALSRVQPRTAPAIALGLLGLGEGSPLRGNTTAAHAAQAVAVGVGAVALAAVVAMATGWRPGAAPAPAASPAAAVASAAPVQSLGEIANASAASLDGRRVELNDVRVSRVTGDVTFWIGDGGAETLVVIDEARQAEQAVTVEPGQAVAVVGTVRRAPPDGVELSSSDQAALEGASLYVQADRVEVTGE